jgi:carbamoyltransferase
LRDRTGCPVLGNASFNVSGEPMVCTPEEAFGCFRGSQIDVLAVGNGSLKNEDQDPRLARASRAALEPD